LAVNKKSKSKKAKEKRTFIQFVGIVAYAQLDEPKAYEGKGTAKYVVKVAPDADELKRIKLEIATYAKSKDVDLSDENVGRPWSTYEETGEVSIQLKRNGDLGPALTVDAKNNKLPAYIRIGRGSKVRVEGTLNVYDQGDGGINIYLNAVQVLSLVENTFGDSPFEETEGYEIAASDDEHDGADEKKDDLDGEIPF
jgi:hypothetical protein